MLSIYALTEHCGVTVQSDFDAMNEALSVEPNFLNEGVFANIVAKVKEIFSKIKMFLKKIVSKIFGLFGASDMVSNFNGNEGKIILRKIDNPYFVRKFYPETYDWNKQYLWSLSDMVQKLDSVRVKLPDGTQIDTASTTIVDTIVDKVNRVEAGVASDLPFKIMKLDYQDAIDKAVKRIFNVYDVSEIADKIRSRNKHRRQFTKKEIYFMYDDLNKSRDYISKVYNVYEGLINRIDKAESAISRIDVDNIECNDGYVQMIQDLMYLLQYKVKVINSIEHIHIEKLRERNDEYDRLLRIFMNL